jgi:hypothetical protein
MAKSDNLTLTSVQVRKSLLKAFKANRPVFIWGPPGIGKSEVVQEITNELGGFMIDLRMAQMEPTDLRGIPYFNKDLGLMDWAPPVDLPNQEFSKKHPIIVLFLDEMNSAPSAVQAAGYQLILNRRVGKYVLPDNVRIVAAGNRESDKGVTYRMPAPLANRFVHLEMRADFTSWQNWAVTNNIHKDVVGYLSFAKNDLNEFDGKSVSRSFATPRSWTFVSQLLGDDDDTDNDTLFNLISGAIGEGLAVKFMAHRKVSSKMPNPSDILSGKVKDLKVKEISAMYSLTTSLCYELRDAVDNKVDSKKFNQMAEHFFNYMMNNFETELVVMGAKVALKTFKLPIEPSQLSNFDEFHRKYGKYILDAST